LRLISYFKDWPDIGNNKRYHRDKDDERKFEKKKISLNLDIIYILYIEDQDHIKIEVLIKKIESTIKKVEEAATINKKEILMLNLIKFQFKEDHLFMINQTLFHHILF